MQVLSVWTRPSGTLGSLVDEARERVATLLSRRAEVERAAAAAPSHRAVPSLAASLGRADVGVIAEVKRRSPSKGWINPTLSAVEQAQAYERGGAAAISVLTEPAHFGGSVDDLASVACAVGVPVLRKDFHIHPLQLAEAKALGASAALLIVRALAPEQLRELVAAARALSLEVIVEVHDERELDLALELGVPIIGINNRDLETLIIAAGTSERLLPRIPANVIAISESGVEGRPDVERVARAGADAVLVGSSVSASSDPADAVHALTGIARRTRSGAPQRTIDA